MLSLGWIFAGFGRLGWLTLQHTKSTWKKWTIWKHIGLGELKMHHSYEIRLAVKVTSMNWQSTMRNTDPARIQLKWGWVERGRQKSKSFLLWFLDDFHSTGKRENSLMPPIRNDHFICDSWLFISPYSYILCNTKKKLASTTHKLGCMSCMEAIWVPSAVPHRCAAQNNFSVLNCEEPPSSARCAPPPAKQKTKQENEEACVVVPALLVIADR